MNILITGATGFVGKRLLLMLEKRGYCRDNIYLLTNSEIEGYTCVLHEGYRYAEESLQGKQIDAVIHLGATTPKGKEQQGMKSYLENIRTTQHLINNLPNFPKTFVFGSSVSVYEEDDYGLSKLVCERLLSQWAEENKVCMQILRFGPIYGPGEETYNKLAGTFLKKAMNNEDIHIFSDGTELRNMIFVDDICAMIITALEMKESLGTIDIVNDEMISIKRVAELAIEVSGSTSNIVYENRGRLREDNFDSAEMRQKLGVCSFTYEQGITELYQYLIRKQ